MKFEPEPDTTIRLADNRVWRILTVDTKTGVRYTVPASYRSPEWSPYAQVVSRADFDSELQSVAKANQHPTGADRIA